ncbi:MAG: hypothetical protein R3F23_02235 [Verrucomicrobiia bacterium]
MAEAAGEASLNAHNVTVGIRNIKAQAEALGVTGATALVLLPNPAKARELQQQVEAIPQPPYPYVAKAASSVMDIADSVDRGVAKIVDIQGTVLTVGLVKNAGQQGLANQEGAIKKAMKIAMPALTSQAAAPVVVPLVRLGAAAVRATDASIDGVVDTFGLRDPIGKIQKATGISNRNNQNQPPEESVTKSAIKRTQDVWDQAFDKKPADPNWKQTPTVFHQ